MIWNLISNLQKRSESERRRIAILIALVFTSLVFAFWIYNFLGSTLAPEGPPQFSGAATSSVESGPSPFATIGSAFDRIGTIFSVGFGKIQYSNE